MSNEIFEEFIHTVSDPAHILTEFTFIAIEAMILTPIIKRWVKRHDRLKHGGK